MFKKKPTIKPLAPLRSSDRRKLADNIIKDFGIRQPIAADSSTQSASNEAASSLTQLRNRLLPDNVQVAKFTTTHGPDQTLKTGNFYIGSHDTEAARILWFELDARIYPSVYTLWHNPGIIALLSTHQIVVNKIQNGADLMIPGLASGPPFPKNAVQGAIVCIASTDSPSIPVAVGTCSIDIASLSTTAGAKGVGVETRHWFGDELWNYSPSGRAGRSPPDEIADSAEIPDIRSLDLNKLRLDHDDDTGGVSLRADAHTGVMTGDDQDFPSTTANQDKPLASGSNWSQDEVDIAFRRAFLFSIHQAIKSHPNAAKHGLDFPLSQSYIKSHMIQPYLPTFTPEDHEALQIKKTSWKSLKKFVKSLDKEQLVKSKDRDGNETVILDIDFDDPQIRDFKPYKLPAKPANDAAGRSGAESSNNSPEADDPSIGQTLEILVLYKVPAKLTALLGTDSKSQLSALTIREAVHAYIAGESLVFENNKRLVRLDPTLGNAVFDGTSALDKEIVAKGLVPRDALVERVMRALSPVYMIARNGEDPTSIKAKAGAPPKISVTLETRSGNKTVTKVSGLEPYHINPRPLADELRKACAGSTAVEPLAGAAKKTEREVLEVMIQGPQTDAVVKALLRRGIDRKWIELHDKTKGKKK